MKVKTGASTRNDNRDDNSNDGIETHVTVRGARRRTMRKRRRYYMSASS